MKSADDWFKEETPLTHRFAIYLPSCQKDGKSIDGFEALADSTSRMLCERFGGVTGYPAKGLYQRESGTPQSEEILVLESFCDSEGWERESAFLHAWARVLSALLHQESIACSMDGNMSFVLPGRLQADEPDMNHPDAMMRFVTDYMNDHEADE
ncbi:MAG: hypothetical protein V4727_01210 [Verrucomicrobiota bacterium]